MILASANRPEEMEWFRASPKALVLVVVVSMVMLMGTWSWVIPGPYSRFYRLGQKRIASERPVRLPCRTDVSRFRPVNLIRAYIPPARANPGALMGLALFLWGFRALL